MEADIENPTALSVIGYVRGLVSAPEPGERDGEAPTLKSTFDSLASTLNDDASVAVGQQLIMKSERVLDAIEDASKNR